MDDRNPQFRGMLVSINNRLNSSELKTLIYYAEIKPKLTETITQPTDLFQILEQRLDLKPNDLKYLRKMIASLDTRKDLLEIIDDYVRDNGTCPGGPPQQHDSGNPPVNPDSLTKCMFFCEEKRMIMVRPCNQCLLYNFFTKV